MLPRFIRLRDAPAYMKVAPEVFENDVLPYLIQIPIGKKNLAVDRLDLDAFREWNKSIGKKKAGPGARAAADARRRARLLNAMPSWADRAAIRRIYDEALRLSLGFEPSEGGQ